MSSGQFPKWDYKEYPKTLAPDDLWGQVRRTVYGKPVAESQIRMMIDAVLAGLDLRPDSVLLDIGCGNAALAARLFPFCDQCLGVDSSEYLISVANTRFASSRHGFVCRDAVEYAKTEANPSRFDRALCFGMFAYLSDEEAQQLLESLHRRFLNFGIIFIGSLPDRDRADRFFSDADLATADLDHPQTQIGVWRTREQVAAMAADACWLASFREMPLDFYQAHYRYNAILTRRS
jgi:SAM-dependent methyltransferase